MTFVVVTKPTVGAPTRKSLMDTMIDNEVDLNARVSSFASAAIANGSFEFDADGDGIPDGWTRTLYSGGSGAINTSNYVSGDQCYSFTSTVLANGGGDLLQTDFSLVAGGKDYPVEAWVKASVANVSSKIEINWYNNAQSFISATVLANLTNTPTTFTNYGRVVTAPATARFAKIKLTGGVPGAGSAIGTIYFDHVVLGEVPVLSVSESMMAPSAISQSKLKTATGQVSTTTAANLTLPGGSYGFYPQITRGSSGSGGFHAWIGNDFGTIAAPVTNIHLDITATGASGITAYANQRYIQASPPYDLGDGEIPLFVFLKVTPAGEVVAGYAAPEAPWHHNGPTKIVAERYDSETGRGYRRVRRVQAEFGSLRAAIVSGLTREQFMDRMATDPWEEIEITQSLKNADMPLIPHPFLAPSPGNTILLVNPVSALCEKLFRLHEAGESVLDLFMSGYVLLDNTALSLRSPPGVQVVAARWKLTP